jgi:hypothetical protein
MARFYSNENVPLPVVEEFRRLGHDVLTSLEAGTANQRAPDREVLRFAVSQSRVLLTLNRNHFVKLHREDPAHCGIIACTFDRNFTGQAAKIHELTRETIDFTGRLMRVVRPA